MDVVVGVILVIGFVMLVRMMFNKKIVVFLLLGFILVVYLNIIVIGVVLFGLVIVLIYVNFVGEKEVIVDDNEF